MTVRRTDHEGSIPYKATFCAPMLYLATDSEFSGFAMASQNLLSVAQIALFLEKKLGLVCPHLVLQLPEASYSSLRSSWQLGWSEVLSDHLKSY